MANAFKCDGCGDFSEQSPNRFKLKEFGSTGPFGWSDSELVFKVHLCDECAVTLESATVDIVGRDQFAWQYDWRSDVEGDSDD